LADGQSRQREVGVAFTRKRLVAAVGGGILAGGALVGGVAVAGGSSGAPAQSLADALNKRAGTSLSASDVEQAFKDVLKTRLDQEVAAGRLTQAQADAILERAANGPPGPLGPRRHVLRFGPDLAALAGTLGLSQDALRTQLKSGKTLAQIAEAQGVARSKLIDALVAAIKKDRPGVTDAQATQLANRIADGRRGCPGGGPGGRGPGGDGTPPSTTTTTAPPLYGA